MNSIFASRVVNYADQHQFAEEPTPIGFAGVSIARARQPSALRGTLYVPLLCLVLQGRKQTHFGHQPVDFSTGDTLIVSINIPTVSQVLDASEQCPYVSIAIEIDLNLIRSLQAELALTGDSPDIKASIASGSSGAALANAIERLFDLHDRPASEKAIMSPLLLKEIHFRMLCEGHGGMLRQLARPDSHESRINQAILKLQQNVSSAVTVNELASIAGMSTSSFHEHFKAVTATTPLQFIKDLRLLTAQQRLAAGAEQVSSVAFDVGYESVAQFSREYSRKFGYPPSAEKTRNSLEVVS